MAALAKPTVVSKDVSEDVSEDVSVKYTGGGLAASSDKDSSVMRTGGKLAAGSDKDSSVKYTGGGLAAGSDDVSDDVSFITKLEDFQEFINSLFPIDDNKYVGIYIADGKKINVPYLVAKGNSNLIDSMLEFEEDISSTIEDIPLPNITNINILILIVQFMFIIKDIGMISIETPLESPDLSKILHHKVVEFINIPIPLLFELITAAHYIDFEQLLDLCSAKIASMIMNKTPEELRILFDIKNDFTPAEEAQIREENKWCEEA